MSGESSTLEYYYQHIYSRLIHILNVKYIKITFGNKECILIQSIMFSIMSIQITQTNWFHKLYLYLKIQLNHQ